MVSIIAHCEGSEPANIPLDDRGLAYGDGLFETILVRHGRPELFGAHCRRMLEGATRLGIPLALEDLEQALRLARPMIGEAGPKARCVLKLVLTRGSGGRGYRPPERPEPRLLVSLHQGPPLPPKGGVAVSVSSVSLTVNPLLAGLKTLNRLEQVLASQSLPPECFEALMPGPEGDLREGIRTALLYRWQDAWWTPPRDRVAVDSVMLRHIEHGLRAQGETLAEGCLYPGQLDQPDFGGLLLVNSVIGVVPVHTLAGRRLPLPERLATIVNLANHVEEFR